MSVIVCPVLGQEKHQQNGKSVEGPLILRWPEQNNIQERLKELDLCILEYTNFLLERSNCSLPLGPLEEDYR